MDNAGLYAMGPACAKTQILHGLTFICIHMAYVATNRYAQKSRHREIPTTIPFYQITSYRLFYYFHRDFHV